MQNLPKIPINVLVGGLGAVGATAGLGWLGWNSVYSGASARAHSSVRFPACRAFTFTSTPPSTPPTTHTPTTTTRATRPHPPCAPQQ